MHCIFTEFYGIFIYEEILYENACFTFFTEFYGICIYEEILYENACFTFFTEFYGICIYEEILYENACFTFFYGILRNFKNILCGSGCFFRFWMTTSFVTE